MPAITVPSDRVFPILGENILVDGFHIVADLEKSRGSVMVDALSGHEYLDCYSYFASLPCGHNHPALDEPEFVESLLRAAKANPANADVYTREFAGFVEVFREIAAPPEFPHLFFVAGGALAVENGMKAAFDWKAGKNRAWGVDDGADKILHFRDAFHGRSGYTLSVTNTDPVKTRDFPKFDWPRISNPKLGFPVDEVDVAALEDKAIAEIEAAFTEDPHGIAAILIEPIQAEGGDNHFRGEFLRRLRDLADRHEALLIFDEVQTGLGMTGKMWAYQHFGVTPDILCFGKKTQVCGLMAGPRLDEVQTNVFRVSSRINSTWGGNLVDMIRCARYLQIIRDENLVENAARVGDVFLDQLRQLESTCPIMTNARGRGLMIAFDLPDRETRDRFRQNLWNAGLASLACGQVSIRFRPSLTFSEDDAKRAVSILESCLETTVEDNRTAETGERFHTVM